MPEITEATNCPNEDCGHPMGLHDHRDGCLSGWAWNEQGLPTNEGCLCPLTLAGRRFR